MKPKTWGEAYADPKTGLAAKVKRLSANDKDNLKAWLARGSAR
ncbi:MAG TPA: hypothetical protein VMK12_07105 [Anaeromyxobacteraceae bacterium]|nr:hypothetical protein [Anaeromyxobacteraceae bacterium]